MRVESDIKHEPVSLTHYSWDRKEKTCTPRLSWSSRSISYQRFLSRSDITSNPPDREGFRKPSPYSAEFIESHGLHGTYVYGPADNCSIVPEPSVPSSDRGTVTGCLSAGDNFPSARERTMFNVKPEQQIINSAFSDLKDQKVQLAMTLAFVRQTSSMITTRATMLRDFYLLAKSGPAGVREAVKKMRKNLDHRKVASGIGDIYLEFLFGWAQLYRDLVGAYEHLNRDSKKKSMIVSGRASSKASRTQTYHNLKLNTYVKYGVANVTSHCERKAVVYGRITSEGLHELAQLGLLNPMELLWDIVRFSWIVDQVIHIGGYLAAYDATAGLEYLGGSLTDFRSNTGTLTCRPGPSHMFIGGTGSSVYRHMSRRNISPQDIAVSIRNPFQGSTAVAAAAVIALSKTMSGGGPIPRHLRH